MIITIAGTVFDLKPNDDNLAGINLEFSAFDGEIGSGQFPTPDQTSSILPVTGRQFKVEQDSTLLTDGFMIDWDRNRGPFRVTTQREYDISVQDANALLGGFRVQQNRAAETDYARVLVFAAAYGPTWDTTWVLNSDTVTMPARKYDTDGGFSELIQDTVSFTGKTTFLHDKAAGGRCLHYHVLTTGHTCGLSISDVVGAANGTTVWAPISPVNQATSVDLRNNILGRDQAGRTSTQLDAASIASHDADGLKHEALIDFTANSQADLNVQTAAYLSDNTNDYHTYTCTIGPLNGTALGLIRVGDIITVTSGAMGLVAAQKRIAHYRLKAAGGPGTGTWWAELELGAPARRRRRTSGLPGVVAAIGTPSVPVPGGGSGTLVQFAVHAGNVPDSTVHTPTFTVTLGSPPTVGNVLICVSVQDSIAAPDTFPTTGVWDGQLVGAYISVKTHRVIAGDATGWLFERSNSPTSDPAARIYLLEYSGISLDAGNVALITNPSGTTVAPVSIPWGSAVDVLVLGIAAQAAAGPVSTGTTEQFFSVVGSLTSIDSGNSPPGTLLTDGSGNHAYLLESTQVTVGADVMTGPATFTSTTTVSPSSYSVAYIAPILATPAPEVAILGFALAPTSPAFQGQHYGPVVIATANGIASSWSLPAYPGTGFVAHTLAVWVDGVSQNATEIPGVPGSFSLSWVPASGDLITASWTIPA